MVLLVVVGFVAVTSVAGGLALVLGPWIGALGIMMPTEMLEGSPFTSYLIPGILLLAVIGGVHAVALVLLVRAHRWSLAAAAVAGSGMLIWIFVQMMIIPFSVLQALYFLCGLVELVLVMLLLDVLHPTTDATGSRP